jgi:hypothetical protein
MRNSKHTPKRKRGAKVVPVLGAAGLLSLVGGAFATTAPAADLPSQKTAPDHEIILGNHRTSQSSPLGGPRLLL